MVPIDCASRTAEEATTNTASCTNLVASYIVVAVHITEVAKQRAANHTIQDMATKHSFVDTIVKD